MVETARLNAALQRIRVSISVSACAILSILLEVLRYSDFWGLGVLVQTIAKSLKKRGAAPAQSPAQG